MFVKRSNRWIGITVRAARRHLFSTVENVGQPIRYEILFLKLNQTDETFVRNFHSSHVFDLNDLQFACSLNQSDSIKNYTNYQYNNTDAKIRLDVNVETHGNKFKQK